MGAKPAAAPTPTLKWLLVAGLVAAGCGPSSSTTAAGGGASTSAAISTSSSGGTVDTSTTTAAATTNGFDDTSHGFLLEPDVGIDFECDFFVQDCPPGYKCNPIDSDGDLDPDSSQCFPLVPDPADIDEPCAFEGAEIGSADNCGAGAVCWNHDPWGPDFRCTPLCNREGLNGRFCEDPQRFCDYTGSTSQFACLPICHPLEDDCPEGQICTTALPQLECRPLPPDPRGQGEPCEGDDHCEPGLFCVFSTITPDCGDERCCTPWCMVGDEDGCPPDHICYEYYAKGLTPPGLEGLGVCGLPR